MKKTKKIQDIENLVIANHILSNKKILDAFGHISIRNSEDKNYFFLSKRIAPDLVNYEDIFEFNLDSELRNQNRVHNIPLFIERFIHGSIYKQRPEVNAVIHSHSASTIPFGAKGISLKPISHMCGFLYPNTPIFDIRKFNKESDMLVRDAYLGENLAKISGNAAVTLMRGHGCVVVADNLIKAVYRSIYTELNAQLVLKSYFLPGKTKYLSGIEARNADKVNQSVVMKAWNSWLDDIQKD